VRFTFDGREVLAYEGETVAAALLAAGYRVLRVTIRRSEPCGYFCGIGVCFQCLVQIDGRPGVQACRTPVADGMRVETQHGTGSLVASS
jgi:predicted molibdopterin-dependent oxidoreductase YjgC